MKKPIKKSLTEISIEGAHGNSGSRQLLFSTNDDLESKNFTAMTKGFLPKGAIFDWHDHPEEDEFFIVLSGKGIIEYEDSTVFEYNAGDVIYNPAKNKHRIVNTGENDNVFYFIRVKI